LNICSARTFWYYWWIFKNNC